MGYAMVDDHRPYKSGSCVRIIDRENGLTANRFTFEYGGPSTVQTLTKAEDQALVAAAALGVVDFAVEAAATLDDWATMSTQQRQDAFEVYGRGSSVERWVERVRVAPALHDKGPSITAAQDSNLHNAAKISKFAFNTTATSILSPWWGTIPATDQDMFWKSWKETA